MNEFMRYIEIIKKIIDIDYEKERVFYNEGEWYDREYCRNLTLDELEKMVVGIALSIHDQYEVNYKLQEKLYELLGDDEGDKFMNNVHGLED